MDVLRIAREDAQNIMHAANQITSSQMLALTLQLSQAVTIEG